MQTQTINYVETEIGANISQRLLTELGYNVSGSYFPKITLALFKGIAECQAIFANVNHPTAIVVEDLNGSFLMGAKLEYIANVDEPSNPGNWAVSWTFNEKDLEGIDNIHKLHDSQCEMQLNNVAFRDFSMQFDDSVAMFQIYFAIIKTILHWLEENVKEDIAIELVLENGFTARAEIENGVVLKSITPEGELKEKIKNDAVSAMASGIK